MMKKEKKKVFAFLRCPLLLIMGLLCSCIHEYPEGIPENPSSADVEVQLTLQLDWQYFIKEIEFSTKAHNSNDYQLIIEVTKDAELKGREEVFFSAEQFANGSLSHPLSFSLNPSLYSIAVWVCSVDESGHNIFYDHSTLSAVSQFCLPSKWDDSMICGYGTEILDLREFRGKINADVTKNLTLSHCGGRFELVATDINDFLEAQKNALLQGDNYTLTLTFAQGSPSGINVFSGTILRDDLYLDRSGELSLPFGVYDELTIASGFVFCNLDEDVEMYLSVHNSARQLIVKTPTFKIPIKRGYVARAKGDFLSNEFRNSIDINHIWDGEITVEI